MKKKTLVIEIDVTDIEAPWTISIQRAQFELAKGVNQQLIMRRTSQDKLIFVPEIGPDNFVTFVIEEESNVI